MPGDAPDLTQMPQTWPKMLMSALCRMKPNFCHRMHGVGDVVGGTASAYQKGVAALAASKLGVILHPVIDSLAVGLVAAVDGMWQRNIPRYSASLGHMLPSRAWLLGWQAPICKSLSFRGLPGPVIPERRSNGEPFLWVWPAQGGGAASEPVRGAPPPCVLSASLHCC